MVFSVVVPVSVAEDAAVGAGVVVAVILVAGRIAEHGGDDLRQFLVGDRIGGGAA